MMNTGIAIQAATYDMRIKHSVDAQNAILFIKEGAETSHEPRDRDTESGFNALALQQESTMDNKQGIISNQ